MKTMFLRRPGLLLKPAAPALNLSHLSNKGVDFLQQPTQHLQLVYALQA